MSTHPPGEKPEELPNEDTRAILDRRRFLIESTLASTGIGVVASGCQPLACLSVEPEPGPCLSPPPEEDLPGPTDEPQVCLEVAPPEPPPPLGEPVPDICLSVEMEPPPPEPGFDICLSIHKTKPLP